MPVEYHICLIFNLIIMEQQEVKKDVALQNELYKDRFQFILSLDDFIICQRYFRINGFSKSYLESYELKETIDDIVDLIKNDLTSKSRVYQWYTRNSPIQLTGFSYEDKPDYFTYPDDIEDTYSDNERPNPYEYTFKFSFMVDEKVVCEKIWDGGDYPRFVRNSVDLTNSDHLYKGREPLSLPFNIAVVRAMTIDKQDLIYTIIKKICDATSTYNNQKHNSLIDYGGKEYEFSTKNSKYISDWSNAVSKKTVDYFNNLFPSKKRIDYIEKYL